MIKGIKDLLRGIPEVVTNCSARVYYSTTPKNPSYPYMRFAVIDSSSEQDFDGLSGLKTSLLQINIFHKNSVEGKKLKDAIINFIDDKHNTVLSDGTQADEFNLTGEPFREFQDNDASEEWIYDYGIDYEVTHDF